MVQLFYPFNKRLTISTYFQGISYVTISPAYNCEHTSGGGPTRCQIWEVNDEAHCASVCRTNGDCVGYTFSHTHNTCIAFTSTGSCAIGDSNFGPTATSMDQLVAGSETGSSCKGKVSGNNTYITSYT